MVCSEPCLAALFCSVYFIENLYLFLSLMVIYQLRGHSKDVRHVWPCFKGKRASRQARERISRCRYSIEVQPTNHINHSQDSWRHQNKANCVIISLSQQDQQGARKVYILSVLLSTILSLAPKLDEVSDAITYANLDLACITETWLHDHIHNDVISIPEYNLVRRDRINITHGGFCTYTKKGLKFTVLEDLYDDKIEAIWPQLRPLRLPRGLSCIIIANVYHPQTDKGISDPEILHYLYDSISTIELRFSNCGVLITGDFNRLNTSRFRNAFKLKQIVKFDTRPHFDQH